MFARQTGNSGLPALLLLSGLALVACGAEEEPVDETAQAAARENVDAMSKEHAADTTEPSPATGIEPARPVVADPRLPYAEIDDELVYGYLAAPADAIDVLPAVIMIHEWWGLNDNVRAMADRLAGEGYLVLAVDLYGGKTADSPAAARELMLRVVEEPGNAEENIRSAYRFLETAGAPRIASLGWCFGGGWSLNAALLLPKDLDAAVIYYGKVTDDEDRLAPVSAPILGLFGGADTGITVESVEAFRGTLERLRKDHEIHIYPGVGHAFANPTGNTYNAEAAGDAWQKTTEFLARHLGAGDS